MTETISGTFSISSEESLAFAKLSGDFNPLHVDTIYARRLQFGVTVLHGVHHMLRTVDAVMAELPESTASRIVELGSSFPSPASARQRIEYAAKVSASKDRVDITARCNGARVSSITLKIDPAAGARVVGGAISGSPPEESPIEQMFPPTHRTGNCTVFCDSESAGKLFPHLIRYFSSARLGEILACTRIVGMKCPGLHSIFSALKLRFDDQQHAPRDGSLRYASSRQDERVRMVKIQVSGSEIAGHLDTFFRPPPVQQRNYAEISATIAGNSFAAQRALVIGGTRGAGEVAAKILAAGGADVTITYSTGATDAEEIQDEICRDGGRCSVAQFSISEHAADVASVLGDIRLPTHVYYFASPHIAANRANKWDDSLYRGFCRFYVDAFAHIVDVMQEKSTSPTPICFFYPSSVYVSDPEKGFAEYAVAKGAGEVLCSQLSTRYANTRFYAPRLPRMATDQTASIIPIDCEDTFEVMYQAVLAIGAV